MFVVAFRVPGAETNTAIAERIQQDLARPGFWAEFHVVTQPERKNHPTFGVGVVRGVGNGKALLQRLQEAKYELDCYGLLTQKVVDLPGLAVLRKYLRPGKALPAEIE